LKIFTTVDLFEYAYLADFLKPYVV